MILFPRRKKVEVDGIELAKALLFLLLLVLLLPLGEGGQHGGHDVHAVPLSKVPVCSLSICWLFITIAIPSICCLLGTKESTKRETEEREYEGTKDEAEQS